MPGPDHSASLEPAEFAQLVGQIRAIELALGSEVKAPSESELAVRTLVRRSVTATRTLDSGRQISASDVQLLRPGDGIPPAELPQVLGRVLRRDVQAGETLKWSDLE
jgi:N,N'-diacetyllegionaminate synthase